MALNAFMTFEVRTTGADTNGGGYRTGGVGIDYSQQDTPQFNGTDLVIDSVTNTIVSSASHSFVANDINNCINITAGTGFTVGVYEIISVSGGKATLDRAVGTLSSTGGTWAEGGAFASWGFACLQMNVAGHSCYIKAGTYNLTSASNNVSGGIPKMQVSFTHWYGYQTTRGDLGTPPLLFNNNPAVINNKNLFDDTGGTQGTLVINLSIDGNNATNDYGFVTGPYSFYYRCRAYNCKGAGFYTAQQTTCISCYAEGNQWGYLNNSQNAFYACVAKGNTGGFGANGEIFLHSCISHGSTNDGFLFQSRTVVVNCTSYGNGRDGYQCLGNAFYSFVNCIAEGNTRWGITTSGTIWMVKNAFYNNTSGAVSSAVTYNEGQINGTSTFFIAAPTNFKLNSTSTGGALLTGTGHPQIFTVNGTVDTPNVGAVQTAVSSSGGARASSYPFSGA